MITLGYLRFVCDDDATKTVTVWVTRCTDLPLCDAAAFVGRESEWPKEVMLAGMREHYPDIRWTDTVQIVEHLTPAETRQRADFPSQA